MTKNLFTKSLNLFQIEEGIIELKDTIQQFFMN
jgi:hypothetical protein